MKNKNIAIIASLTFGALISPLMYASVNELHSSGFVSQEATTVTITVTVNYLGQPLDGVSASIIKDGKIVSESMSDSKGKAVIDRKRRVGKECRSRWSAYQ